LGATPLKADLIMLSVADANFRILVEYVHSCNVDCDLDGVACLRLGTGRNSCCHILLLGGDVEVDLSAHKLCYFYICFDHPVAELAEVHRLVVERLGTETCDNFLADVFLKLGLGSLLCGKLKGVSTECEVDIVALLLKSTV